MDADTDLLDRLRAGDEAAFAALVQRYQSRMLRLATATVGSRAVAEEVVQDTWLAVVRGVERFEGRSSLRTWLFHILLNRARSAGGREQRAGTPDPEGSVEERFDATGAWAQPPEPWADRADDRLTAERMARRLQELLGELPDLQRQVVLLRDVEGLAGEEVAALMGVTDGHQRVLLHRGRSRLRQLLAAEVATA